MIDNIGSPPSGGGPERISLSSIKTTGLDPTGALGLVTRPKLTIKSATMEPYRLPRNEHSTCAAFLPLRWSENFSYFGGSNISRPNFMQVSRGGVV